MTSPSIKITANPRLVLLVLALVFLSFFPVWQFYVERMFDGSDEPLGVIALFTLFGLVVSRVKNSKVSSQNSVNFFSIATIVFLALYSITFFSISKLASAVIAMLALMSLVSWLVVPLRIQEYTLALLSLPAIASVNFYAGYPLRVMVAKLSSIILGFGGIMTKPVGTLLQYKEKLVYVDAPCGGVKLLWISLFVTATLCSYLNIKPLRSTIYLAIAAILSLIANSLRVTSLFYIETGLVKVPHFSPDSLHQYLGLAIQAILLIGIVYTLFKLSNPQVEDTNKDSLPLKPSLNKLAVSTILFLSALNLGLPFIQKNQRSHIAENLNDYQLPEFLESKNLKPVKIASRHKPFLANFPGTIKFYNSNNQLYIIKWIRIPTRKVHPASDCYQGAGYKIDWRPIEILNSGEKWSCFHAIKGPVSFSVKERIIDSTGKQWTDPSSWYWSALLGETKPPWWGITVEEGGLN